VRRDNGIGGAGCCDLAQEFHWLGGEIGERGGESWEKERVLAILDRVLCIESCEGVGLPLLEECQSEARQIRKQVFSASEETSPLSSAKLRRRVQAFSSLLLMIESPESLSDDQWWAGQELVAEEFGRPLAVAGARHRLRLHVSVPSFKIGGEAAPESEGSSFASPSPAPDGSNVNELLAERAYGLTEEGIGKEVDEILTELMQQGLEPMRSEAESAEPCNLTEQERSEREYARENLLPEEPLATLKKWEAARPDPARVLSSVAMVRHKKGRYDQAESLYQQALKIRERELGPDDLKVATTLNNLAVLYLDRGRYLEAESLCSRSLAIVEKAWGRDHPKVARRLSNLADIYAVQNKYEAAAALYERALAILEMTDNKEGTKAIAASLMNYVFLLRKTNSETQARKMEARIRARLNGISDLALHVAL
jgi:tetratricopeptide (TPR) repeat protein